MKLSRAYYILIMCLLPAVQTHGQEVYRLVREGCQRSLQSPAMGVMQREAAAFELAALDFLQSREVEEAYGEAYDKFLDTQAYCLSAFMDAYADDVLLKKRLTPEKAEARMRQYKEAAARFPLLPSCSNGEATRYLQDAESLTPFSLNTDWQAALEAVR